jgi:hypothetical protein
MNLADHRAVWAELDIRFYDRMDTGDLRMVRRHPHATNGQLIARWHGASDADVCSVQAIKLFSTDWKSELAIQPNRFRINRHKGGHNWSGTGVDRVDVTVYHPDTPFHYWGKLYTAGSSCTCKLRRLTTTHQLTHLIPAKAIFAAVEPHIWHAAWLEKRMPKETYFCHFFQQWHQAPSRDQAVAKAVAARLGIAV